MPIPILSYPILSCYLVRLLDSFLRPWTRWYSVSLSVSFVRVLLSCNFPRSFASYNLLFLSLFLSLPFFLFLSFLSFRFVSSVYLLVSFSLSSLDPSGMFNPYPYPLLSLTYLSLSSYPSLDSLILTQIFTQIFIKLKSAKSKVQKVNSKQNNSIPPRIHTYTYIYIHT